MGMESNDWLCSACRVIDFKKVVPVNRDWKRDEVAHGRILNLTSSGIRYADNVAGDVSAPACILCATRLRYLDGTQGAFECLVADMPHADMSSEALSPDARPRTRGLARLLLASWNHNKLRGKGRPLITGYWDKKHLDCVSTEIVSRSFQPQLPLRWIERCRSKHECESGDRDMRLDHSIYLIDCKTRSTIQDDGQRPYACLSYVWGDTAAPFDGWEPGMPLPDNVPATIEDAMAVTLSLGHSYLWVDRYCINQHDTGPRQDQIDQMDTIYSRAVFTIVAAAGDGGNSGLPGLSLKQSSSQPAVEVGGVLLTPSHSPVEEGIKASRWNSRGWTYQEALLSRRCLVFTEEHVLFVCSAMACWRAHECLETVTIDKKRLKKELCVCESAPLVEGPWSSLLRGGPRDARAGLTDSYGMIAGYSKRTLGRKEDVLNGIKGILNRHRQLLGGSVDFIWGVAYCTAGRPFPAGETREAATSVSTSSFIQSLCWRNSSFDDPAFPGALNTDAAAHSGRRYSSLVAQGAGGERIPLFPSWAWTGWAGRVGFPEFFDGRPSEFEAALLGMDDEKRRLRFRAPFLPIHSVRPSQTPCPRSGCAPLEIVGIPEVVHFSHPSWPRDTVLNKLWSGEWRVCLLYSGCPFTCFLVLGKLTEEERVFTRAGSITIYWRKTSSKIIREFAEGISGRTEEFVLA